VLESAEQYLSCALAQRGNDAGLVMAHETCHLADSLTAGRCRAGFAAREDLSQCTAAGAEGNRGVTRHLGSARGARRHAKTGWQCREEAQPGKPSHRPAMTPLWCRWCSSGFRRLSWHVRGGCWWCAAIREWTRPRCWAHILSKVAIAASGIFGAIAVIAVNLWMNQPGGHAQPNSRITSVNVWPRRDACVPRVTQGGCP
jgi:hypothetical protein